MRDTEREVRRNDGARRYEIVSDEGELIGLIDYRVTESTIDLFHAETNPAHGGKGYGSLLVEGALDDIRESLTELRFYREFVFRTAADPALVVPTITPPTDGSPSSA